MSPLEITASLEALQLSIESIEDEKVRAGLVGLLNLVEALARENETLREENQRLKDEINRMKGEQGKPQIKGKKRKGEDISSERER
jgi:cell division protein FtsB